ncbi:UDP-N-acetylmuramate--L-alanine ligase [Patescibacteria group bacterium]|nr:UDP-N-acetylmuramate--L-alanine ligase [Patescibacteria group bacterium]
MNIEKAASIHFVGIGGIGTSSIAQILQKKGKTISGSDNVKSDLTENLKKKGIKISYTHAIKNIPKDTDLIIYSPAIPSNNPELQTKIPSLTYPQALGELTKSYYTIAIAGTHGKSTTTAMLSNILTKSKLDPTVVIGTKIPEFNNENFRVGESQYLIIEACEYKNSFSYLHPNILVITNVEADHLDHYKTEKAYIQAFKNLAQKIPKNGAIIINPKDKNTLKAVKGAKAQIIPIERKKDLTSLKIQLKPKIPGDFNLDNAAFAATAAILLNVDPETIQKSISTYRGSWRRFEIKKVKGIGATIIDDYGHHPTEIKATLKAIREKYGKKKVLCIYQPHQYSRTRFFLKDFGKSFKDADQVIIPNIYEVRDSKADIKSISPEDLVKEIGPKASYGQGLKNTAAFIKENHKNYDIIVTMGAGDIENIYKML